MVKMEYTDIVKKINTTLYVSIPRKLADKEEIEEGDNVRVKIEEVS